MAYNPWAEEGGDEDEDNTIIREQRTAKVANAMIIDARPNMFEVNSNGDIPFANCLRACAHTLKNQVICEDTDFVGIYLAGAAHKSDDSTFDHIHVFKELSAPTASLIRQIDTALADLAALQAKLGELPPDAKLPLAHAIWSVNLDVAKKKLKETDSVALWIFTNDDDPFRGDQAAARQCIQRARDGAEQGHECVCAVGLGETPPLQLLPSAQLLQFMISPPQGRKTTTLALRNINPNQPQPSLAPLRSSLGGSLARALPRSREQQH